MNRTAIGGDRAMMTTDATLAPEIRALDGADGLPVVLSDGEPWLLADGGLRNALDDIRDRLFDQSQLAGSVPMSDVVEAAWMLLAANYDLTPGEGAMLLAGVDRDALAEAVMACLFGAEGGRRTYTSWAASALLANGLDPAAIPGAARADVLRQLVATGRAVPAGKWIDSAVAAPRLAAARARAARPIPQATPPAPGPAAPTTEGP